MKYKVVQETLTEEVIEIEAESENEAIDLIELGGGELVDHTVFRPTLIGVEELESDDVLN